MKHLNLPDDPDFKRQKQREIPAILAVCLLVAIIIVIGIVTYFGDWIDNALL